MAGYSNGEVKRYFKSSKVRTRKSSSNNDSPLKSSIKVAAGLVGVCAGVGLLIGIYLLMLIPSLPTFEQLENPDVDLATVLYTADGEVLTRLARQDRTPVHLDSISHHVVDALVATEDYRFHEHWGLDLFRLASSAVKTVLGDRQGGSTITQQLARNLYDEIGTAFSVNRKLKEMITALTNYVNAREKATAEAEAA